MKELVTLIGFCAGLLLATAAHATGQTPSCQKTGNGHQCTVPGGDTIYNVKTDSEATAIASVVAMLGQNQSQQQGQGQAQGQNQTATGGSVNYQGGDTYIAPAPSASADGWCYTLPTGGVCVPLKTRMIERRQDLIDRCLAKTGRAYVICIANIDDSYKIKRAVKQGGVYGDRSPGECRWATGCITGQSGPDGEYKWPTSLNARRKSRSGNRFRRLSVGSCAQATVSRMIG